MRPGIKRGQCCKDSVTQHPVMVVSIVPVDPNYSRVEEFLRRKTNNYKKFKIYGISLVDGSLRSFYISRSSVLRKYTIAEAYLARKKIRERKLK